MNKVRSVINRWPDPAKEIIAQDCGVTGYAIEQWEKRGRFPAKHWDSLIKSAKRNGIEGVSLEFLFLFNKKNGGTHAKPV